MHLAFLVLATIWAAYMYVIGPQGVLVHPGLHVYTVEHVKSGGGLEAPPGTVLGDGDVRS